MTAELCSDVQPLAALARPVPVTFPAAHSESRIVISSNQAGGMTMSEWTGKVALVTGGTSGIGREAALLFAQQGARVVVAGRREQEGKATVDLIRRADGEGLFVKTDVSRLSDVRELVDKTVAAFGGLDCAFNNAGTEGHWTSIIRSEEH